MFNDREWWSIVIGFLLFGMLLGTLLFSALPLWIVVKPWVHAVGV